MTEARLAPVDITRPRLLRVERKAPGQMVSNEIGEMVRAEAPGSELHFQRKTLRVVSHPESTTILKGRGTLKFEAHEIIAGQLLRAADSVDPRPLWLPVVGIKTEQLKPAHGVPRLKVSALLEDADGRIMRERRACLLLLSKIAGLPAPPTLPYVPDITFARIVGPEENQKPIVEIIRRTVFSWARLEPPSLTTSR